MTLLGVAGAYAPPALVGLLNATSAYAGATSKSSSGSASESSRGHSSSSSSTSRGSSAVSGSQSVPVSSSESSESTSSSSESAYGSGGTFFAVADSFIRRDAEHTNEGANTLIRVGVDPVTRGLVLFDRDEIYRSLFPGARVQLVLRIANNHNNWGQYDDRTVSVHPLFDDFAEGNGKQSGMPGSQAQRGSGAGATWNSPEDPNIADNNASGATRRWEGAHSRVGRRTAPAAVHVNQVEGVDVYWDVTADVTSAGGFNVAGWMIRVDREPDGDDEHPGGRLPAGFDRGEGGTVEYFSKDGVAALGLDPNWAPRLIIS